MSKIEVWAGNLGYVVENIPEANAYVWFRSPAGSFNSCSTASEVFEAILEDIRSSYAEGE
jgi:hypothetical protein